MDVILVRHPVWARQAGLHQVNLRQYTPEGRVAAFEAHPPRRQRLGAHILWLMPIQPVGVKQRQGTLGSGDAIGDHLAVDPDHARLAHFRRLGRAAQALGLTVITDRVANHAAWDHRRVGAHPAWYLKDVRGEIHSCVCDNGHARVHRTDVLGLEQRRPAVCGGQESGLDKRRAFFAKRPTDWKDVAPADVYATLPRPKHEHPALANGAAGAPVRLIETPDRARFAFRRVPDDGTVGVSVDLCGQARPVRVPGFPGVGELAAGGWHIAA